MTGSHLDAIYVEGYDAKSQVDPSEDIEILRSRGLGATSTVVDLGAGTGAFAFAAARTGATVIAVDVSPAMTSSLRRRADEEGLGNALHQLPDFWKVVALRDISRLLRPGGVLRLRDLVFDVAPDRIEETIEAWMAQAVTDPARGYTAEEFAEHVRAEHSTFTWLFELMLDRTGFEIIDRGRWPVCLGAVRVGGLVNGLRPVTIHLRPDYVVGAGLLCNGPP